MTFRGLFIGIDRYRSSNIKWLNCAANDAKALHALFIDNLSGNSELLIDASASKSSIENAFVGLQDADPTDIVVIGFSGHGTSTHELVTYDADGNDLPGTCIPLPMLFEWFKKIPAKRLILILDCCFSGGLGAKALESDYQARDISSTKKLLDQIAGEGRLIFTASSATEQAWEHQRKGHGFLTYYLLEALQGAEEVRQRGKVDLYALLKYVTDQVRAAASQIGKVQTPAMRGTVEGSIAFPVFKRGKKYVEYFPKYKAPEVTADLQSLAAHGFPAEIIKVWETNIPRLNELQLEAINHGKILEGDHLVVSAPTSSGKTMIGELVALYGVASRKKSIFLFPLKALVNDKHRQFTSQYAPYGVKTIRATGDANDQLKDLIRGQYDICLMTYEKFTSLALGHPHLLEQVSSIIIDEVQMIADKSRGINLEFVLTLLRMRRRQGIEPQIIALSAVIGSTNGLENWLSARLLVRKQRPVPLDEGVLTSDGTFRYIATDRDGEKNERNYILPELRKGSSQDMIIPLVRKLVGEGKQVIVFRETKGQARGTAKYLSEELSLPPATSALMRLSLGDPSLASNLLRTCLSGGVAFHISDLDREERSIVEETFRLSKSEIRVIVATTTLAMGVNTPAEAVVVAGLVHPGPIPQPYSIAEYKNIIGRAGRLGYATRGTSYLLSLTPKDEAFHWSTYILGTPEDLKSQFFTRGTDSRSLIIRALVTSKRSTKNELSGMEANDIIDFIECSFGAYQLSQQTPGWKWERATLTQSLDNLEKHKLIAKDERNRYRLTELGWLAGQGGIEVASIIALVDAFSVVNPAEINDPTLIAAAQLTVEVDEVYCPVNARGPQKELSSWSGELVNQNIARNIIHRLINSVGDPKQAAARCKKIVACLLWISSKSLEEIEDVLTRHGGRFDGIAGPVRGITARTHDVLAIVARVAEIVHPTLKLQDRAAKLMVRLEVGIPSSVYELAKVIGTMFTRGDYIALLGANLSTVTSINEANDQTVLDALQQNTSKMELIRALLAASEDDEDGVDLSLPALPPYEA